MKTKLLALVFCALSLATAQTKASLSQQTKATPVTGATTGELLIVDSTGKIQQVTVGPTLVLTKDLAGKFTLNAVPQAPVLASFLVSGVTLAMQSDGTAVLGAIGNVVSGSVAVHRNGILQGGKDVTVDTNDPTKIKVTLAKAVVYDPTDDWAVSYQRQ